MCWQFHNTWSTLGAGVNGVVTSIALANTQIQVAGNFTTETHSASGLSAGVGGFANWEIKSGSWVPVNSGGFVMGNLTFVGNGSTVVCQGICLFDTVLNQWSALGSICGATSLRCHMLVFANTTWTAIGDQTVIPGPVTAVEVNSGNSSSIFAVGRTADGSSPFMVFWDGVSWSNVAASGSSLQGNSNISQLLMVPLQNTHSSNSVIESDRMLMISGALSDSSFGSASSVLFDGQTFVPYIVSMSGQTTMGYVLSLFYSITNFSFSQQHFLATGVVILISIAIAVGVVFLLALIGIVWTPLSRRDDKFARYEKNDEDDDSIQHRPSSLLEHINAATRTTILGTQSPFNNFSAEKGAAREGTIEPDPFGPDASNYLRAETPSDAVVGSMAAEEEVSRPAHARYSFDGTGEGELLLTAGVEIEVLDDRDNAVDCVDEIPSWWYAQNVQSVLFLHRISIDLGLFRILLLLSTAHRYTLLVKIDLVLCCRLKALYTPSTTTKFCGDNVLAPVAPEMSTRWVSSIYPDGEAHGMLNPSRLSRDGVGHAEFQDQGKQQESRDFPPPRQSFQVHCTLNIIVAPYCFLMLNTYPSQGTDHDFSETISGSEVSTTQSTPSPMSYQRYPSTASITLPPPTSSPPENCVLRSSSPTYLKTPLGLKRRRTTSSPIKKRISVSNIVSDFTNLKEGYLECSETPSKYSDRGSIFDDLSSDSDGPDTEYIGARLVLEAARAQRNVRHAEKVLSKYLSEEHIALGRVYQFQEAKANRRLVNAECIIGAFRSFHTNVAVHQWTRTRQQMNSNSAADVSTRAPAGLVSRPSSREGKRVVIRIGLGTLLADLDGLVRDVSHVEFAHAERRTEECTGEGGAAGNGPSWLSCCLDARTHGGDMSRTTYQFDSIDLVDGETGLGECQFKRARYAFEDGGNELFVFVTGEFGRVLEERVVNVTTSEASVIHRTFDDELPFIKATTETGMAE
ncbi:cortical protein marker for cell polarity-domain-containing protein [Melanogaster broomeanus]|nr:cortical protein marker for cell polarity-domain-containing protein [Melanogaster broomeanus]